MEVEFKDGPDSLLERTENGHRHPRLPPEIVRGFRKRMRVIRAATDVRDLYQIKSNHFKKMQGDRAHQHSMRINDQWRLVIELGTGDQSGKVYIVDVEDYH